MYQQPYEWNKDKLGIPIYTESETKLNRVPVSEVYEQILSDIDKGYNYLKGKGIAKKDELNEYAAAAIMQTFFHLLMIIPINGMKLLNTQNWLLKVAH